MQNGDLEMYLRESFPILKACYLLPFTLTQQHIYLRSPFTNISSTKSILDLHIKTNVADLNILKIFCKKNETMPYSFKKESI